MLRMALAALALLPTALAAVPLPAAPQLAEVLYNPVGADAGNEWVELANPGALPLDVTGYTLEDDDACRVGAEPHAPYRLALNGTIPPLGRLVVPLPDLAGVPKCLALANTGDVLVLRDADGAEVDRVAWPADAPAGVKEGLSIQRCLEGGWVAAAPTPGEVGPLCPPA